MDMGVSVLLEGVHFWFCQLFYGHTQVFFSVKELIFHL